MAASVALISGVIVQGLAVHLARSDPRSAASFASWNARAAVAAAQDASASGARVATPEVRRLTRLALERDVTLTPAIELRALQAQADRDDARAAQLFDLSSAISRRSLPTRLALIQRAVDRGDVNGALKNFDIALRTSTAAPDLLFPVLARATRDPGLAAPIAGLLDHPSDWRLGFLHYAITDAHAGVGVAGVVLDMRDRRFILDRRVDESLIGELVGERQYALAHTMRDRYGSPDGRGLVADGSFADTRMRYPFGWNLIQSGTYGAERAEAGGEPALRYETSPGGGGPVATQLLTLTSGDYHLVAITATPANDTASQPFWTVTCDGGRQLVLADQPGAAGASTDVAFTVPLDCPGQWLTLTLRASDEPNLKGAVRSIAIEHR